MNGLVTGDGLQGNLLDWIWGSWEKRTSPVDKDHTHLVILVGIIFIRKTLKSESPTLLRNNSNKTEIQS